MQFLSLIIQEKELFGAIFNNLFTLSSTSCWSFSFAWFNSWKKNYIQLTCFMPTYYQSSWAMISFSIFSLNCIPKKCKQVCHIRRVRRNENRLAVAVRENV